MWARRLLVSVGVAGLLLPAGGAAAAGPHFTCSMQGLVREVEVRENDPARDVTCAVLYRKQSENPGVEQVLWTAQRDRGFCVDKAQGLVERLEGYGWVCEPVDPASAEPEIVEARVPPEPKPEPSPADAGAGQARVAPELKPEPAPTVPAVAPPDRKPDPVLRTAIAQDLDQLKGSSDATVDAQIGALGDLNGDGRDDAAVVITFDPGGDDHAQYLVAYVADGTTFRPAASKFLGGRYREIYGGEIEAIQDGEIRVNLDVLKADDPYCCPSGQQAATFTLAGEELLRRD